MGREVSDVWFATADPQWRKTLEGRLAEAKVSGRFAESAAEILEHATRASIVVLDEAYPERNAFALCRAIRSEVGCQVFLLVRSEPTVVSPIARFCGAQGTWTYPPRLEDLTGILASTDRPVPIDRLLRAAGDGGEEEIRRGVLRDLETVSQGGLLDSITDPETKLFNYPFLLFKLDEEYKRASRFKFPLSCVMLGFDGEASEQVLLELAGIFLNESRDTDILGRFDLNSFLFLLPNTGPDGARVMADRMAAAMTERKLKDLTGDSLQVAIGISYYPHPEIVRREQLYERARAAFLSARDEGLAVCVVD